MDWLPIETAPEDGTVVLAGRLSANGWHVPYPIKTKFEDGKWCFRSERGWVPYSPQPDVWMPWRPATPMHHNHSSGDK